MLNVKDGIATGSRRWQALGGVALLAVVAAFGLHGTNPAALAEPPKPSPDTSEPGLPPLDISYVLPTTDKSITGIFAVRASKLVKSPGLEEYASAFSEYIPMAFGKDKKLLFGLSDIEQVSGRLSIRHEPEKPAPNSALMLSLTSIRMVKEFDWVTQLSGLCTDWKEHAHADIKYYSGKISAPFFGPIGTEFWCYMPDNRTVVIDDEGNIKKLIERKGKSTPSPAWAADWATVEGGVFGLVMTDPSTKNAAKNLTSNEMDKDEKRLHEALDKILSKADLVVVGADIGKKCELGVTVSSRTAEDGNAVFTSCSELVTWAEEKREAAAKAGKVLPAKVSLSIRRGVNSEPQFRHQTGVHIEFNGGMGDLVKGIQELAREQK